jgi:putative membrane protein insertion efficiency factor
MTRRRSPLQVLLVAFLRAYRAVVSPLYGQVCRYHPSCSAYALGAVETHGGIRGSWLAARRLGRCHPWASGGVDLVPAVDDYRWWGRCPGTDPYAEGVPAEAEQSVVPVMSDIVTSAPPAPETSPRLAVVEREGA